MEEYMVKTWEWAKHRYPELKLVLELDARFDHLNNVTIRIWIRVWKFIIINHLGSLFGLTPAGKLLPYVPCVKMVFTTLFEIPPCGDTRRPYITLFVSKQSLFSSWTARCAVGSWENRLQLKVSITSSNTLLFSVALTFFANVYSAFGSNYFFNEIFFLWTILKVFKNLWPVSSKG